MKAASSSSDQSPSDNKTWFWLEVTKSPLPAPPIFDKKTLAKQQDAKPPGFFSGYTDDASVQGSKNLAGPF